MLLKACPRCRKLIPQGLPYCEACRPIAEAQAAEAAERRAEYNRRKYNKRRDPKYLTFYRSKDWRTLSRVFLQDKKYKCEAGLEGCQRLAVEVHHKDPIQTDAGWERRLDWDNLEALCTSCHNRRHDRFNHHQDGVLDMRKVLKDLKSKEEK